MKDIPLLEDFPIPTYEEWRKVAEESLQGAPFEKKLLTKTYEGITLQPLYRAEDCQGLPHLASFPGFPPYTRAIHAGGYHSQPWEVCQETRHPLPRTVNQVLRSDLERGQTAIHLVFDRATRSGKDAPDADPWMVGNGGVSLSTVEDLEVIVEGIDLEQVPLYLNIGAFPLPFAALFLALLRKQRRDPSTLRGCIGVDPLGTLVQEAEFPYTIRECYDGMAHLVAWCSRNMPEMQTILVQADPYHHGGASVTQELAFALATGVEYLRAMQDRGVTIQDAATQMRFSFSIGPHFFMEIARLRAARYLWAKIVKAFGGDETAQKMVVHVRTSLWNTTRCDPYVNMLRATTEALAGAIGGCASMHVGPFDELAGITEQHDFSRRIARNTQIILQQENHMTKVIDPAGGSWYVEWLTDAVGRKAWGLFQEIERQGGMLQALQAGVPQRWVAEIANQRASNIAHRRDILVGTNMYPNLQEQLLADAPLDHDALVRERTQSLQAHQNTYDVEHLRTLLMHVTKAMQTASDEVIELAIRAAQAGATLGMLTKALRLEDHRTSLPQIITFQRGALPFEHLRANALAYRQRTGHLPQVFLATMGPVSQHKARADFSAAFFAAGGFEAIQQGGFASPEEAAQAALASGAPIVVICSTDDTYPELVPPLTRRIKQARPETMVILAGYPQDQIEAHQAAGVDEFIHIRSNCYRTLAALQQRLGIATQGTP